jgi:hypothetical protein
MNRVGHEVGQIYIYRNLFDLRARTLGNRPQKEGEQSSLRHSQFFKDGTDEGPFDLFHNTCVILDPGGVGDAFKDMQVAGFGHYKTLNDQQGRRRAFNNIFVVVYSQDDKTKAIAFLPPNSFAGPTDGNLYHRFGTGDHDRFLVPNSAMPAHQDLGTYQEDQFPYEKGGRSKNPLFRSFDESGQPHPDTDDFRLSGPSPARHSPVILPDELKSLDKDASGLGFLFNLLPRDRGCYYATGAVLRVGVKGRRRFPPT